MLPATTVLNYFFLQNNGCKILINLRKINFIVYQITFIFGKHIVRQKMEFRGLLDLNIYFKFFINATFLSTVSLKY